MEPLVAFSSMGFYAGMLLFAYIAIRAMYKPSASRADAYYDAATAAGSLGNNPAR
jgi:hypothetical protein